MTNYDDISELARKLEPVIGKRAKALWHLNLLSGNSKQARENTTLMRLLADKKAKSDYKEEIRLPPPLPDKLIGGYNAGTVIYPDNDYSTFGFKENEFIKHILIVGMTGTGKTNLAFTS